MFGFLSKSGLPGFGKCCGPPWRGCEPSALQHVEPEPALLGRVGSTFFSVVEDEPGLVARRVVATRCAWGSTPARAASPPTGTRSQPLAWAFGLWDQELQRQDRSWGGREGAARRGFVPKTECGLKQETSAHGADCKICQFYFASVY